jgi:hypothetical protein
MNAAYLDEAPAADSRTAAARVEAPAALLVPEWERLLLLAYFLARNRQGQSIDDDDLDRLRHLKTEVDALRAPRGVWEQALGRLPSHAECDVLAAVAAPDLEPRLGWAYQQLQQPAHGGAVPFPSRALLQELLALDSGQAQPLRAALAPDGWLRRERLVRLEGDGAYQPLLAEPALLARLSGRGWVAAPPPGADCLPANARWDDLVLPADRLAMLREFLLWIEHRTTVVDAWGGQVVGGPVALFAGPSGTGKTFAASVLAAHLGWQLYRVDLGRVVSKYVGETEENLNRLFEAAHGQPVLLQFDEADALFAKRGEVKEARDRYANMEVSHLLTRIEAHHGPCILTTNLRRQLDAAFTRRIQVVIEFPRPDTASRAALWHRLLPPQAPRAADVDCAMLASSAMLTGGQIRNAALHAAYLAAGAGTAITLPLLALAVWRELGKDGREIALGEIGALAAHLPMEIADAQ